MGLSPRQIDALTLAELTAMHDGFKLLHGGDDDGDGPDEDDFYRALAEARAAEKA